MTDVRPLSEAWAKEFAKKRGQDLVIAGCEDDAMALLEQLGPFIQPTLKFGLVENGQYRVAILYYPQTRLPIAT